MASLARILAHFGRPSEAAIASALLFLTTADPPDSALVDSHTMFHLFSLFCADPENPTLDPVVQRAVASANPSPTEWRPDVLVQAVSSVAGQFNAPLDWRLVVHSLDVAGLEKKLTQPAFVEIAKAYIAGSGGALLPADCILDTWIHRPAQLCIISHALASPECITWDTLELFEGATPEDAASPYSRVALIEKLIELNARDLLQFVLTQNADLVLLSLTCSKPKSNTTLQQKLTVTLLSPIIAAFPKNEKALRQMWNVTPALVEAGIISMWRKEPVMMRVAYAIAIDMRILHDLLNSGTCIEFSLELAMLACRDDRLDLEKWFMEMLTARGLQVISAISLHLAKKARITDANSAAHYSLDAVRIVFRCMLTFVGSNGSSQTHDILDGLHDVHQVYVRLNSRIRDLKASNDVGDPKVLVGSEVPDPVPTNNNGRTDVPPSSGSDLTESISEAAVTAATMLLPTPLPSSRSPVSFPNSIEKEAGVFFENLYTRDLTAEKAVEVLRGLKEASSDYDRRVYQCAMHSLFDEYRFFKKYPDRELEITGRLFGSIIQEGLLALELQGLALKCILDALKTIEPHPSPPGRLATFGLFALERFVSRLPDWPQFCSEVLKITRLQEVKPAVLTEVKRALKSYHGQMPSPAEREIGLNLFPSEGTSDVAHAADGAAPPAAVRDLNADADAVSQLVASPPQPSAGTPLREPVTSISALRPSPSMGMDGGLVVSPTNLTILLGMTTEEANDVVAPEDTIQDKIKFIFNNLSHATMDVKVKEMLEILDARYHRFFSVYIVVKRASTESNFHHLYLTLLERMSPEAPTLMPIVFDTTHRRIKVLLRSEKIVSIPTERMVLKSLGSWIGALTLARNQAILRRDLDLKELLMDAYSRGRLIAVVPFVSKILEASRESRIFKTTNPWIAGVLSLMKEIYCVPELKLNMKFELQLLCKSLDVDVNEVTPSDLLRDRPAPDKNNNSDFNTKKAANSSPLRSSPSPVSSPSPELRRAYVQGGPSGRSGIPMFSLADPQTSNTALPTLSASVGPGVSTSRIDVTGNVMPNNIAIGQDTVGDLSNILANASLGTSSMAAGIPRGSLHSGNALAGSALQTAVPGQRQTSGLPAEGTVIPNLANYITISPTLVLFQTHPNLKRILPFAIDRAIREIIQPVVERSCAIAFLTTKELTLKDFANEPDTAKLRRAALQMVQQLAGSLALVTSKEPLRVSMGNQLRSILSPVAGDQALVEQTSQVICAANLEVGCAVIERHAKEKAARDLNEKIAPAFNSRRPQPSAYNMGLIPGAEVLRVYDEFGRIPRLGAVSSQYAGGQHPAVSSAPAARPPPLNPTPQIRPSNGNIQPLQDHRVIGTTALDSSIVDIRTGSHTASTRGGNATMMQGEISGQTTNVSRRALHPGPAAPEVRASSALYGTIPPIMASAANVAAALVSAAGSSNGHGANGQGAQSSGLMGSLAPGEEALSTQQVLERFNAIYPQLTAHIGHLSSKYLSLSDIPGDHDIHSLWMQIPAAVKRSVTADEAGMAVAQKVFKGLYEGEDSGLNREVHVLLLEGLRECCRRLSKELVSWLAYSEEHKKLHRECVVALLKPGSLLNITNYDELLSKTIDNGRNVNALEFACFLVHRAVIDEPLATAAELFLTLEAMAKVGRRANPPTLPSAPEGLLALVDASRKVVHQPAVPVPPGSNNNEGQHVPAMRPKEAEIADPPGIRELIANCLADWQRILASDLPHRPIPEQMASQFLTHLRSGLCVNDEARERFFRITLDLITSATMTALRSPRSGASGDLASAPYTAIDATVRLVSILCQPEPGTSSDDSSKGVYILCQFLVTLVKDILKSSAGTDSRPHFRIFSGLIQELGAGVTPVDIAAGTSGGADSDPMMSSNDWLLPDLLNKSDAFHFIEDKNGGFLPTVRSAGVHSSRDKKCNLANMQVSTTVVAALTACSPLIVPGFAFSWLQLMSSKELLPRLLMSPSARGGNMFLHLLVSMLKFLSTYLKDPQSSFTEGVRVLYKGTLRVLLVLLHDFPEFLCDYHMAIVDVIPHNCVQLRNIVLASFPKSMRLPDPFLPELKVDQLPEMASQPRIMTKYMRYLESSGLKSIVGNYLQQATVRRSSPLRGLGQYLMTIDNVTGEKIYSVPTIGALVLYVGQYAISRMMPGTSPVMEGPVTEIVQSLTRELEPEGQYHLFNAVANQLRYPNCHTLYYSRLVLCLFQTSTEESVKEQITRVLLERLIANRPHPWGLLVTFVELVKNSLYNFWGHEFVRCAPEIEELFENVAKVCIGPALQNQQQSLAAVS